MEKRALIVLNGSPCSGELAKRISEKVSYTTCADGGYSWYSKFRLKVNTIAGDLDSSQTDVPEEIEIIPAKDQNLTDFEKTLSILTKKDFNYFYVIGATGKEHDHFLSNLAVTAKYSNQAKIMLLDDLHRIWFVQEKNIEFKTLSAKNPIISIFGWPKATFDRSLGLEFPLDGLTFDHRISGSRNKGTSDEIRITLSSGSYFIFANDHPLSLIEAGIID